MNIRKLVWTPLFLTACVGGPEDVQTSTSELVFGAATSLRPEIGEITTSSTMCTATLIAPSVILTAAHCLNPTQNSLTTLPGAPRFAIRDFSGSRITFVIDRVHSFNWDSFAPLTPGVQLTSDVAIAHLDLPVAMSQAVPARIAAARPTNGAASTMFGLGCSDRIFQDPFGTKRFVTFSFGTGTTSLCPGDSGGPEVFGDPAGGGAVWGVSTGAVFFWDTFADVAAHRTQIEALIRSWDGLDERNTDRLGLDYFWEVAPTVAACRRGCENDGRCRSFSWRASDQMCWRKSGVAEPRATAGITSGLPVRLEAGVDRLGGDFGSLSVTSADECAVACARTSQCVSWTQLNGTCFLKNSVPNGTVGTCPACTSGVLSRGFEPDTDRIGGDYSTLSNISTREQCAAACVRDARCAAFTHLGLSCYLKDSVWPASSAPATQFMTSGVRRGMDPESDRTGAALRTITVGLRPEECQSACANDASCQAWSFRPMGTNGSCRLMSSVGTRVGSSTNTSGLRGLELLPPR